MPLSEIELEIVEPVTEQIGELLYTVDALTGEILSVERPGFVVDSVQAAEWLLDKLQDADARIGALKAQKAARDEFFDSEIKREQRKRDGLLYKYEGELIEVARQNLPEGRKTWACEAGSVQFRTNPARLKVVDSERALDWAKEFNHPEAIKVTEEFQISKLDADQKQKLQGDDEWARVTRETYGFDVTPASETATISTGIK